METPHSILKKFFGYDSFRPGQEQIVQRLLAGQDVRTVKGLSAVFAFVRCEHRLCSQTTRAPSGATPGFF